jgi:hypothetical protein
VQICKEYFLDQNIRILILFLDILSLCCSCILCLSVYCDMTPQIRNSPLLSNGPLTYLSVATDKKQNNRGTVSHVDLYSVLPEVIKDLVQSLFAREPSLESSAQFKRVSHSVIR